MCLSKINSSTIGTMQRTAITVNYLQMLCLLVMLFFFFLRRVALIVGVLFSSKSLLCLLGCLLVFFEELLYMLCYLFLASSKVYFTCGVAWLVERWSFVSCFSVSINRLKTYEQHFMIQFYKLQLLEFLVWSSGPDLGLLWSYSSEMLSV